MAEEAKKFDLYLGGKKVQEGVTSPIEITNLEPGTKYDKYALAYAGVDAKVPFSFETDVPVTTTTSTVAPTTTTTTQAPVTTTTSTVAPTTTTTTQAPETTTTTTEPVA